jgi:hypothetical protein
MYDSCRSGYPCLFDQVAGPDHVDFVELLPRSSHGHSRSKMHNSIHLRARPTNILAIADVAKDFFDAFDPRSYRT